MEQSQPAKETEIRTTYSICSHCRSLNRVVLDQPKAAVCGKCKTDLPFHDGINALGSADLQTLIQKSPLPIVVDFWAPWCGPCKSFAPIFQTAARDLAEIIVFVKVDTQANPMAGDLYQIRSIPTLAYFNGGLERDRVSGALPLQEFLHWLQAQIGR
jgi:thioredoxin 2